MTDRPSYPFLATAEEAFDTVRAAGFPALALHLTGSLPFAAAVLFFYADCALAPVLDGSRLLWMSFGLAALFVWMKTWQTFYARRLRETLLDIPAEPVTPGEWLRVCVRQAALQPWSLAALPLAVLATVPFAWVHAFFQNLTVLDDGASPSLGVLCGRAVRAAKHSPKANHLLIWAFSPALGLYAVLFWLFLLPLVEGYTPVGFLAYAWGVPLAAAALLLSPFFLVVAANVALSLLMLPQLARIFLGIRSVSVWDPGLMEDGAFIALVAVLSWLCLDPLVKAVHVVRCHHSETEATGEDLLLLLRRSRTAVSLLLAAAALALGGPALAGTDPPPAPPDTAALDTALDEVLSRPEYAWRVSREFHLRDDLPELSFLREMGKAVQRAWEKLVDWVDRIVAWFQDLWDKVTPDAPEGGGAGAGAGVRLSYALLLAALALLLLLVAVRYARRRRERVERLEAVFLPAEPDPGDEAVTAADLPEDRWRELALEHAARGEFRTALRAAFLGLLGTLARDNQVAVARHKSNREYAEELRRRAHARPEYLRLFADGVGLFEPAWYGTSPADRTQVERMLNLMEETRRLARS